jgi:hypothetical protein
MQRNRRRPLEEALEEFKTIPRDYFFVDDNIMADREYVRSLFKSMAPARKRLLPYGLE